MKKIITDEFIAYKSGFLDGKQDFYKQVLEDSLVYEPILKEDDDWYSKGYNDGYNYILELFLNNNRPSLEALQSMVDKKIIDNKFVDRVLAYNKDSDLMVSIGKFRM